MGPIFTLSHHCSSWSCCFFSASRRKLYCQSMINGHLPKAKVKSSFGFYRGTSVYVYQSPAPTQPRLVLDSFLGPSFSHCLTHQPGRRLNQLCVTFNAWRRTLKCQTWTVASHRRHKSTHTHTHYSLQWAVTSGSGMLAMCSHSYSYHSHVSL